MKIIKKSNIFSSVSTVTQKLAIFEEVHDFIKNINTNKSANSCTIPGRVTKLVANIIDSNCPNKIH